jgi:hypothetical protein
VSGVTQFRFSIYPFGLGRKAPARRRRRVEGMGKDTTLLLYLRPIFDGVGSNTAAPLVYDDASDAAVHQLAFGLNTRTGTRRVTKEVVMVTPLLDSLGLPPFYGHPPHPWMPLQTRGGTLLPRSSDFYLHKKLSSITLSSRCGCTPSRAHKYDSSSYPVNGLRVMFGHKIKFL